MTKRFHNTSNTAVRLSQCFTLVTYSQLSGVRDWSLITGRRGTKREGGRAHEILPLFSHAEGGGRAQRRSLKF